MGGPLRVLWVQLAGLAIGLLLVALGLWLARRARRGGRAGAAPHCARCNYNLTGLVARPATTTDPPHPTRRAAPPPDDPRTARPADHARATQVTCGPGERCPECGTELAAPRAILAGRRTPRRFSLAVGVTTIVLGLAVTFVVGLAVVRYTNWYAFRPSAWVLADAASGDDARVARAVTELIRREQKQRLSDAHRRRLAARLLEIQGSTTLPLGHLWRASIGWWLDALGKLADAGMLSGDQAELMRRQSVLVQLKARPRALAGRPVPIELGVESRARYNGPVSVSATIHIDGVKVGAYQGLAGGIFTTRGTPFVHALKFDALSPGRHAVRADFDTELHTPLSDSATAPPTRLPDKLRLTTEVATEVVAAEPADLVRLITDPARDPNATGNFRIVHAMVFPETIRETGQRTLGSEISLTYQGAFDVAVAFDLVVAFDGRRIVAGRGVFGANPAFKLHMHNAIKGRLPLDVPERVSLILVPSLDAALATVDVDAIWHAPITLGPVTIANHERTIRNLREEREIELRAAQTQPSKP
ncbi:MAG: hypothetical protein AB7Q17_08145 [Phycisphaerae bacterium]